MITVWKPIRWFLVGLGALVLADFIIFLLGRVGPAAGTALWGTFGDWAQGILPGGALLSSVYMWIEDRKSQDRAARALMGDSVYMHLRSGRAILTNQGTHQIYVASGGQSQCIPPGQSVPFDAASGPVKFTTAVGEAWVAELDKPSRRL